MVFSRRSFARGWIWIGCVCAIAATSARAVAAGDVEPGKTKSTSDAAEEEFFEAKVRPVLVAHCLECHGPEKHKGGLRLDARDAMLKGGETGPVVVPGKPEAEPAHRGDPLRRRGADASQGQAQGRRDRRADGLGQAGAHLARAPSRVLRAASVRRSTPPRAIASDRARTTARSGRSGRREPRAARGSRRDLAGLADRPVRPRQARGQRACPSPPADKRTLIRRATFDLIGLPPTPEEIDAFVRDDSPDAFARVVDRLLASPHYGERWGRYWLDVARYGEDQAHSFQPRLYPNGLSLSRLAARRLQPRHALRPVPPRADRRRPDRRARADARPAGGAGLLRLRPGLLRRRQEARPVRRPDRYA